MNSLKSRITVVFSLVCALCLLVSMLISSYMSYGSLLNETNNKYTALAGKYSEKINGWIKVQGQIVDEVVDSIEQSKKLNKKEILKYLTLKTKVNKYTTDVYMGFTDKSFIDGSGWPATADYDCTTRGWYQQAINEEGLVYGKPSFDLTTKKMVTSISKPVKINGKSVGVVSMDIDLLSTLSKMVNNSIKTKGSYAFLIDSDNDFMIHPNKKFNPNKKHPFVNAEKVLKGKYKSVLKAKVGQLVSISDYDGSARYFTMSKINVSGWKIGFAVIVSEYLSQLNTLILISVIIIIIGVLISIIASFAVSKKITNPIIKITELINKTGELNLVYDSKYEKLTTHKTEIGVIAKAVVNLRKHLREINSELKNSSDEVLKESAAVTESINETMCSIDSVSKAITEIAQAVNEEAKDSQSGIEKLAILSDEVSNAVNDSNIAKQLSIKTKENSITGMEHIELLSEKLKDSNDAQVKASRNVELLSKKSESIGNIINTINSVAEQTSISTKEIRNIIIEIQNEINATKSNMDKVEASGDESTAAMKETGSLFTSINKDVSDMVESIEKLSQAIMQIDKSKDEVVIYFNDISAATEQTAASSEEVSASMDEQAASMDGIGEAMNKLKEITKSLNQIINRFKF